MMNRVDLRWTAKAAFFVALLLPPLIVDAQLTATAGFDATRLDALTRWMQSRISDKRIPGTVMLVAKEGKTVYSQALGMRDPVTADPLRSDAIFRMYSMTKPITSVAAMILVEEGKLHLGDPVTRYLPELKGLRVAIGKTGSDSKPVFEYVPAKRTATIQDLMRHTAGWTAPNPGNALERMYSQNVQKITSSDDFVNRVATLPLAREPGTSWEYSISHDVLGVVIERVSGKKLDDFLEERVFKPLGMNDTSFSTPPEKHHRIAEPFLTDPESKATLGDFSNPRERVGFAVGGGESEYGGDILLSTAADYMRFLQMVTAGGTLDGVRIVSRKSVELITSDHLKGIDRPAAFLGDALGWAPIAAMVRNSAGGTTIPGSIGEYSWGGYGGTYFIVDPREKLVAIRMSQAPWSRSYDNRIFRVMVYSALQ